MVKQNLDYAGGHGSNIRESRTLGWLPTCDCGEVDDRIVCTVLDPFCGIGTTNLVAAQLGRRSIGIDLKREYLDMAINRIRTGLRPHTARSDEETAAPLFGVKPS